MLENRLKWIILTMLSLLAIYATSRLGPEKYIGWTRLYVQYFMLVVILIGLYFRLGAIVYGAAFGIVLGIQVELSRKIPGSTAIVMGLLGMCIAVVVEAICKWEMRVQRRELEDQRGLYEPEQLQSGSVHKVVPLSPWDSPPTQET